MSDVSGTPVNSSSGNGFKKDLNLFDSTLLIIGSMIGSAIFLVSSDIARIVGSPGLLLLVWIISGLITLAAALSFGELAAMMPKAGGQYIYLREAFNPLIGFLYGWTFFLVIQTGSIAAIAVAFAKFAGVLFPAFKCSEVMFSYGIFRCTYGQLLAIGSIILLTLVNIRGVHEGKIIQNVLTTIKTIALFGMIVLGIWIGFNHDAVMQNLAQFWDASWTRVVDGTIVREPITGTNIIAALGVATVGAFFAMDAWNNITFTAGEVINPRRNIPLSLALGTIVVISLYILANVAYLIVLPLQGSPFATDPFGRGIQFAYDGQIGVATAYQIFGIAGAMAMAFLIMLSSFGCNNGLILSGARVFYAMAQDRLFFKSASKLNKKGAPSAALIWQCIWSCLLCLTGTYEELLDYVIFAVLIFYILTILGIFVLRRTRPYADRPYKALFYPYLPGFYVISASAICFYLLVYKPTNTWPGLALVLLGIPVYYLWNRINRVKS